jgi:hypothetical protein
MMRRLAVSLFLPLSVLVLAGCGSATSTAGFSGEKHAVAQTIANLQSHATAAEEQKICSDDLASSVVARLGGEKPCEKAIKSQLNEVDSLEMSVESVAIATGGTTASARVKSVHEGKSRASTLSLVKEAGKWKISGV